MNEGLDIEAEAKSGKVNIFLLEKNQPKNFQLK
jgi:hypothetical protein